MDTNPKDGQAVGDTPRTDVFVAHLAEEFRDPAWIDFARELERENARLQDANKALSGALEDCDNAFAAWQLGQIPGRPEDILGLINKVRRAIACAEGLPFFPAVNLKDE